MSLKKKRGQRKQGSPVGVESRRNVSLKVPATNQRRKEAATNTFILNTPIPHDHQGKKKP